MDTERRPQLTTWARWSLFWTLFIGIGAVGGALGIWIIPDTMGIYLMLPSMQGLPFAGFFFSGPVWPGVFLLLLNGVTQLGTAALILRRHRLAPYASLACGLILIGWISLQFVIFELNPVTTIYGGFALAQTTMAVAWVRSLRAASH